MDQIKETLTSVFTLIKDFIDKYVAALKKLILGMQNIKEPQDETTGE
ncbi:MAG: hypothetical protein ACI4GY_09490 [Acutalibacteraceae bacterium]